MKNLITKTILGLTLLTGAAQANSFFEYSLAQSSAQESQIFGIQPVSEIVGSDSIVHKFKYGIATERSRIFFLGTVAPDKNNEMGLGFGGEWHTKITQDWDWFLGTEIIFAKQATSGDSVTLSTNANKVNFVTDQNISRTPTKMTYEKDTFDFQIGLTLGTTYNISKNLDLVGQYKYGANNYSVSYKNEGTNISNDMNFKQDTHEFGIGLAYKF
jgi:hypothetical protein